MFTVKATDAGGHRVYECAGYQFRKKHTVNAGLQGEGPKEQRVPDTLDLYDADGSAVRSFPIAGTTFVMNSHGKTVDIFDASPD